MSLAEEQRAVDPGRRAVARRRPALIASDVRLGEACRRARCPRCPEVPNATAASDGRAPRRVGVEQPLDVDEVAGLRQLAGARRSHRVALGSERDQATRVHVMGHRDPLAARRATPWTGSVRAGMSAPVVADAVVVTGEALYDLVAGPGDEAATLHRPPRAAGRSTSPARSGACASPSPSSGACRPIGSGATHVRLCSTTTASVCSASCAATTPTTLALAEPRRRRHRELRLLHRRATAAAGHDDAGGARRPAGPRSPALRHRHARPRARAAGGCDLEARRRAAVGPARWSSSISTAGRRRSPTRPSTASASPAWSAHSDPRQGPARRTSPGCSRGRRSRSTRRARCSAGPAGVARLRAAPTARRSLGAGGETAVAAVPAVVADTIGAGDAFRAAALPSPGGSRAASAATDLAQARRGARRRRRFACLRRRAHLRRAPAPTPPRLRRARAPAQLASAPVAGRLPSPRLVT